MNLKPWREPSSSAGNSSPSTTGESSLINFSFSWHLHFSSPPFCTSSKKDSSLSCRKKKLRRVRSSHLVAHAYFHMLCVALQMFVSMAANCPKLWSCCTKVIMSTHPRFFNTFLWETSVFFFYLVTFPNIHSNQEYIELFHKWNSLLINANQTVLLACMSLKQFYRIQ